MSDWRPMDPNTVRATGVLYAVNKHVLWPLGLALAVDYAAESLVMISLSEPEVITEGNISVKREPGGRHPQERFIDFAAVRISEMPSGDQEMALRALSKIVPGIGISPLRDSGGVSE